MKKSKLSNVEDRATYKTWEAAVMAGCGDRSIRTLVAKGIVPSIRFGRHVVIPKQAFMRWLDSCGGKVDDGLTIASPPNKKGRQLEV